MKTRLICLFLCVVMLLSVVLTSCGKKDDDTIKENITDAASESAMTLTMWVVVEEALTEEVAKAVSDELNSISKAKFKTQLIVNFLTADQYQATLSDTIAKYEATAATATTEKTVRTTKGTGADVLDGDVVTDETRVNNFGFVEIVYPPAVENQVDIIYVAGKDMFDTYVSNKWLAPLDSELNGASKKIKEYVANALLSASKQDGVTYAIPNNNVIGEYTYMLLDKKLMEKYNQHGYFNRGLIDGFCNEYVYNFIDQVAQFETNVIPVDSTYEDCLDMLAHYWTIDPESYEMLDGFSAFGYYYTDLAELSRGSIVMGYQSLFENEDFATDFLALNRFRMNGYFADADDKQAAVKFVKGDKNSVKQYQNDYYAVPVKYPTASVEDIYSNMFGVYNRSKSIPRSMEIISYLNTNEEFRNTLLYGVEDVHYTVVEDDEQVVIERDKYNRYIMDIDKTGNAFLAYLDLEANMSADIWETGKEQNRDALVEPLLGFDFKEFSATTTAGNNRVTIDKKGYNLSYSTGYSKEVLAQNEALAAWIAECDAAGNGMYVFKTSEPSGQYITYNYYLYNTLGNGYDFVIAENPIIESITDEEGYVTEKQIGVNLVGTYTAKSGDATAYELTMASVYTRKSYQLGDFAFVVDDAETAATVKEQATLVSFDAFNTKNYSISIYEDLSKAGIRFNYDLLNWFKKCEDLQEMKKPHTFILSYADTESVAGKTVYTYVLLRNGMENITDLKVVPTGNGKNVDLAFIYSDAGEKLDLDDEDGEVEPTYVLDYLRVTVANDAEVSYNLYYQNLSDKTDAKKMIPSKTAEDKYTVEEAAKDPDFVIWGNLDTELVKFLYQLNQDINEMVTACGDDYEALESLVHDLGLVLSSKKTVMESELSDEKLIAYLTEQAGDRTLQSYLNSLTERIEDAVATEIRTPEVNDEGDEILYGTEPFVYYASPCTVYYMWLTQYKYLPESETAKK